MNEDDKAAQPTEQQSDQSQITSVENAGVESHQHGGDAAAAPTAAQEHGNQPASNEAEQTGEGTGAKAGEYS